MDNKKLILNRKTKCYHGIGMKMHADRDHNEIMVIANDYKVLRHVFEKLTAAGEFSEALCRRVKVGDDEYEYDGGEK